MPGPTMSGTQREQEEAPRTRVDAALVAALCVLVMAGAYFTGLYLIIR